MYNNIQRERKKNIVRIGMNVRMKIVEKISNYFLSETGTELEKAMFIYGLQIIIHDMSMVIFILLIAYLAGVFWKVSAK